MLGASGTVARYGAVHWNWSLVRCAYVEESTDCLVALAASGTAARLRGRALELGSRAVRVNEQYDMAGAISRQQETLAAQSWSRKKKTMSRSVVPEFHRARCQALH